ncbi:hypothetical protein [Erythrobacter sp. F6033]|uniref:hypothetical protein n=1 Tax=Erythrobacter sp. F6033 TaxID=2926401 RepID=UPI001FF4BC6A|nr:hypothetical protein [Erythrobacter sp. F6033]MCK0127583.1 hypothetical protein [Erythrobacter sp. F6033]
MTSGTELAAASDPFAKVVGSLETSLHAFSPLVVQLGEIETVCADISTAMDYAADVPSALTTIEEILETVSALCQALIEVPFVDVVAEIAAGILDDVAEFLTDVQSTIDPIIKDVVTPCKDLFSDLAKSMKEAVDIVTTLSQTLPDYLNTVQILSYCLDLVDDILPYLAGTQSQTSTEKFVAEMIKIRDDVATVLTPLATFASDLVTVYHDIENAMGTAFSDVESIVQTVKDGLGEFEKIMDPISHAFHAIEDAIAPVKWVLDAVASLINKILAPIIHAVLEATGIEALLKPLETKLEDALGVGPLFNLLDKHCDKSQTESWNSKAGPSSVASGKSSLSELGGYLKKYDTRDKGNTYALIQDMINAILAAPGNGKLPVPPKWPYPPKIKGAGGVTLLDPTDPAGDSSPALAKFTSDLERQRLQRIMSKQFAAIEQMARPFEIEVDAPPSQPLWVTETLLDKKLIKSSYDAIGLPNVTLLLAEAATAKKNLTQAESIGPAIAAKLKLFDQSRQLPSNFQTQMEDFSTIFNDCSEVVGFLAGFSWSPSCLTKVQSDLAGEAALSKTAYTEAQALETAADSVESAIQKVEAAIPAHNTFTRLLQFIDQIAAGACSAGNTLRRAQALDAKLSGKYSSQIAKITAQIDGDAAIALSQMKSINSLAVDAMNQAGTIEAYLTNYAGNFSQLTKDSSIVAAKAMPSLSSATSTCNTLASIIDPLSGILTDLNCKSAKNSSVVSDANAELNAFKASMKSFFSGKNTTLNDAFLFLINKEIPVATIVSDIDAVNSFIKSNDATFTAAVAQIESDFAGIKTAQRQPKSFQYQKTVSYHHNPPSKNVNGKPVGGGKLKTTTVDQKVDNFFVDGALRTQLLQLVQDMNNDAVKHPEITEESLND